MITSKNEGCLDKFKVQPAIVLDSVTKEPCAESKRQRTSTENISSIIMKNCKSLCYSGTEVCEYMRQSVCIHRIRTIQRMLT